MSIDIEELATVVPAKQSTGFNKQVISKIIVRAKLKTTSPTLIGKGKGEDLDMELIRDNSGKPYIPGSSFAGMFSHHFNKYKPKNLSTIQQESAKQFFGSLHNDRVPHYQSHFAIEELRLISEYNTAIRDGVEIRTDTGTAKENSKYDYEILEKDAVFAFEAEITLRNGFVQNNFLAILKVLEEEGQRELLRIGAFTSFGFGKWKWEEFNLYVYDFPNDHIKWLVFQETRFNKQPSLGKQIFEWEDFSDNDKVQISRKAFSLNATFEIKSSLIIGHYSTDPNDPDKTQLTSKGEPALPGKSIKGSIRTRARKILNTIAPTTTEELLKNLMGHVTPGQQTNNKQKSRLIIEEATISNAETKQIQPRVKLDRFTGGSSETALFDSEPLWHKDEKVQLSFTIDEPKDSEIGLLLLILKDLWTEDLAIGGEKNIGRGILKGISAELYIKGNKIIISEDGKCSSDINLQSFVDELLK